MGRKSCWVEIEFDKITGKPINGDLMTITDFIHQCQCGALIDYDGYGNYSTENMVSDIKVWPSKLLSKGIRKGKFTHVLWYNR